MFIRRGKFGLFTVHFRIGPSPPSILWPTQSRQSNPISSFPCDDLAVRHLHQLHSSKRPRYASEVDIPALIVRSLGPPESYTTVYSRYLLLKISREEGILTPETSLIGNIGDLEQWRSAQPFPWVLKADGTTGGVGVRIAHTLEEARGYFSDLRRPWDSCDRSNT